MKRIQTDPRAGEGTALLAHELAHALKKTAPAAGLLQRSPTDEKKKKPGEKTATSQLTPQKIPALEVRKETTVAPAQEKKGVEATASLGTETEIKKGEHSTTA